jgi:hypothetical protein
LVFDVGAGSELWGRLGHDRIETAWLRGGGLALRRVFALKFQAGEIALFIPWRGWQPKVRRLR